MSTNLRWKISVAVLLVLILCVAAWLQSPRVFFVSYLTAVMLPWSVSVGSLALMLVYSLTGGKWAEEAWPGLAMNARLMPLVAILFIPVLVGASQIYPWANSDVLTQFENTGHRQWYFQMPFFVGRTVLYFVIWTGLSLLVVRSRMQPLNQGVAGLALIAILLTLTWAGMDWVMSFDPFFASTLFGALIGIGAMLAGMSAAVIGVCFGAGRQRWMSDTPGVPGSRGVSDPWASETSIIDDKPLADLSSLLLAFLMLWAYLSFSHFLIMWTGDLPGEAAFYVARNEGVWKWLTPLMSLLGFVVPFLCLLSYDFKRTPQYVGSLAVALLVVRQIELCWMVLPVTKGSPYAGFHWSLLPTVMLASGLYIAGLAWQLRHDASLADAEVSHVE